MGITPQNDADAPMTNATRVKNEIPSRKLDVAVSEDTVTLIQTSKTQELDADGQPQVVDTTDVIEMAISERTVNQYTIFKASSESFESSKDTRSDREEIALVEIDADGTLSWQNLRFADYKKVYDDTAWDLKIREFPGVKISTQSSSDTHRSNTERKLRVDREAVDSVRAADGRLVVVKWRDARGGSENSSSLSKFQPLKAVELIAVDK